MPSQADLLRKAKVTRESTLNLEKNAQSPLRMIVGIAVQALN